VSLFATVAASSLVPIPVASEEIPLIRWGRDHEFYDATAGEIQEGCVSSVFKNCKYDIVNRWAGAYVQCVYQCAPDPVTAWAWVGKTVQIVDWGRYKVYFKGYWEAAAAGDGIGSVSVMFKIRVKDLSTATVVAEKVMGEVWVVGLGASHKSKNFWGCIEFDAVAGHQYSLQVHVKAYGHGVIFSGHADGITISKGIRFDKIKIGGGTPWLCNPRRGCPWVETWDGAEYQDDNNVLWMAYSEGDRDYYKLERSLLPISEDNYTLKLSEMGSNLSHLDKIELITIDHSNSSSVAVDRDGEILVYSSPLAPVSVYDNNGTDRREEVLYRDNNTFEGNDTDYLEIDFGQIGPHSKASLITAMWRKPIPVGDGGATRVQVYDSGGGRMSYGSGKNKRDSGTWIDVGGIYPRADDSMLMFNLTSYLTAYDSLIRLQLTSYKQVDYVGLVLDEEEEAVITNHTISWANHSKYGDATSLVIYEDQTYRDLNPGDDLTISFNVAPNQEGLRDFVLLVVGYSEDYSDP